MFKVLETDVKVQLRAKSDVTELDSLKKTVLPTLRKFETSMDNFTKDNANWKNIVERFDEVITLKASKISLKNLEKEVELKVSEQDYDVS